MYLIWLIILAQYTCCGREISGIKDISLPTRLFEKWSSLLLLTFLSTWYVADMRRASFHVQRVFPRRGDKQEEKQILRPDRILCIHEQVYALSVYCCFPCFMSLLVISSCGAGAWARKSHWYKTLCCKTIFLPFWFSFWDFGTCYWLWSHAGYLRAVRKSSN